jgi:hypothetical protein
MPEALVRRCFFLKDQGRKPHLLGLAGSAARATHQEPLLP